MKKITSSILIAFALLCLFPQSSSAQTCTANDLFADTYWKSFHLDLGSAGYRRLVWDTNGSVVMSGNTITITGLANEAGSSATGGWNVSIVGINKKDWTAWNAANGTYSGAPTCSANTTWTYYEYGTSTLTGTGSNAGKTLTLVAKVGSRTGLQLGSNGANGKTCAYGIGGWFDISGSHSGSGDIYTDVTCPTITCDADINTLLPVPRILSEIIY